MHILTILIGFFILCVPSSYAQQSPTLSPEDQEILEKDLNGTVRGFIWGLPPTVILENETGTFMDEKEGVLFYLAYIRGLRSTIGYEFEDSKLWRAQIFIEENFDHPQDRLETLLTIQTDLNKRFGDPVSEEFKWRREKEKNFPDQWGWAVYRGELLITIKWQNEDTDVTAFLGAKKSFSPELWVSYENRQVKQAKIERKRQDLLKAP